MSNILLFGLSADMPHWGHIQWIDTLKKEFPKHTIIVMPCSANPLGKLDEDNKTIYPSNGYLRWQMLYDFYKKHDPAIIVSQYEVAINTPSTTIATIRHLMRVSVKDIKEQRGYIEHSLLPKDIKNNITLAIGAELFNELPLWHEWQEIIKLTNIVIIKRSGYNDITIDNLENKELINLFKLGIKDGSITHLNGPQIAISSRELKKQIKHGADDQYLLTYIPKQILNFIRQYVTEFSNAYYQNKLAREVYDLAMEVYKLNVLKFDNRRKSIFSAYISDLRDIDDTDQFVTNGYKLKNGRLIIDLNKVDHIKMQRIISEWMKKLKKSWFNTSYPLEQIIAPKNYNANFKVLGKFGANLAVDIVLFTTNSKNELKILSILRDDDMRTPAIPGGFNESDVLNTCIQELLEECFSNALFEKKSISNNLINKTIKKYTLINNLKSTLKLFEQKLNYKIISSLLNLLTEITNNKSPSEITTIFLNELKKQTSNNKNILAKFKCALYQITLPEQFALFKQFIINNGIIGAQELSSTDERNTNLAWVETQAVRFILNEQKCLNIFHNCGLELSGGDDATKTKLVPVLDFCTNQKQPFALHAFLVLRDLARILEDGKISLPKDFVINLKEKIKRQNLDKL